jgi:hypothetical protein
MKALNFKQAFNTRTFKVLVYSILFFAALFSSMLVNSELMAAETPPEKANKTALLGMSVTGNKESPKSLTIVPWRSPSMKGDSPEISPVWQPSLKLLEPSAYRRDINLFLIQRHKNK